MGSVATEYRHVRKQIDAADGLTLPGTDLKWYDLHVPDAVVTEEVRREARDIVRAEAESGRLKPTGELGFVILHRVADAFLLLVCTWRNDNELWETVYFKDTAGFELVPFDDVHKGTYCVWEMGVILHEQQAWIRYLISARDEAARRAYLDDRLASSLV